MGSSISRLFDTLFAKEDFRILMLGLDSAGKTTILYKLKLGETLNTVPTVGFNVETVEYKYIKFTVWDVGAPSGLRRLWWQYYEDTKGLIYVVDSSDEERLELSKQELHRVLSELKDVPVVVLANKQDKAAISVDEMSETFGLNKLKMEGRKLCIYGSNAVTGEGLYEGLEWLNNEFAKKK